MSDVQAMSELFIVLLEKQVTGFDQYALDDIYAKYDNPNDLGEQRDAMRVQLNEETFFAQLEATTNYLLTMEATNKCVSQYASDLTHMYSLWASIGLNRNELPDPETSATRYSSFMSSVKLLRDATNLDTFLKSEQGMLFHPSVLEYWRNSSGASTDLNPRLARYKILLNVLQGI